MPLFKLNSEASINIYTHVEAETLEEAIAIARRRDLLIENQDEQKGWIFEYAANKIIEGIFRDIEITSDNKCNEGGTVQEGGCYGCSDGHLCE